MSKNKLLEPTNSEEIDLGQLFKLIGRGFSNFFNSTAKFFIGIYKILLLVLIHFYRRIYWYLGAIIIGLITGYLIDSISEKKYDASMYIETNFNSTRQVYENIRQFNQLAFRDKDTLELAKKFNINPNEASKLIRFGIEPDWDENVLVKTYSEFYSQLDSISQQQMSFDKYKSSLKPYHFTIHKIIVTSTNRTIHKKIEKSLLDQISGNTYLIQLAEVNKLNLERKEKTLLKEIQKTDTLISEYLKIRINESKKEAIPGSGTTLYMGDAESSNLIVNESSIVDKLLDLEAQRRQVTAEKVTQENVINVLSNFPESGYEVYEWYDKMIFLFPIILFSLALLAFTLNGLRNYLGKEYVRIHHKNV